MIFNRIRKDLQYWDALSNMLSSLLSGIAIVLSVWIYLKVSKDSSYQNFDTMYYNILQTGIENPDFRNSKLTTIYKKAFNDQKLIQYEIYAYMTWNFCETLYDMGDADLLNTWKTALETENQLHREWFDAPENAKKYKDEFRFFVHHECPE